MSSDHRPPDNPTDSTDFQSTFLPSTIPWVPVPCAKWVDHENCALEGVARRFPPRQCDLRPKILPCHRQDRTTQHPPPPAKRKPSDAPKPKQDRTSTEEKMRSQQRKPTKDGNNFQNKSPVTSKKNAPHSHLRFWSRAVQFHPLGKRPPPSWNTFKDKPIHWFASRKI